jgi:hypothetical protein
MGHPTQSILTMRQVIKLFIALADELYGPITTIRHDGRIEKHIRWLAFQLKEADWARVFDTKNILLVRPYSCHITIN